jgi:hypothetical protein
VHPGEEQLLVAKTKQERFGHVGLAGVFGVL